MKRVVSWRVEVRKKERKDKNQEGLKTKVNRWKERERQSQSKQSVEANIERERECTCFLSNTSI
jgi:hypothetical protein